MMKICEQYKEKWKESIAFLKKIGFEFTKKQDFAYRTFPGGSFSSPGIFMNDVMTPKGSLSYDFLKYHNIKTGYDLYRFVRNLTILISYTSKSTFLDYFDMHVKLLQKLSKENSYKLTLDLNCAIRILGELRGIPELSDVIISEAIRYLSHVFEFNIYVNPPDIEE